MKTLAIFAVGLWGIHFLSGAVWRATTDDPAKKPIDLYILGIGRECSTLALAIWVLAA